MSFAEPRTLSLSLLAALVLAGCAEKGATPLKKGKSPWTWRALSGKKCPPA